MKKQLCALLILATAGITYSMEIETEKTTSQDLSGFSMRLLSYFICNKNEDGVRSVLAHAKDLDKDLVMEKLGYQIAYAPDCIFSQFLNCGIDVNKRLGESRETLATATLHPSNPDASEKLRLLIGKSQTDLNVKNSYGYTAIMYAAVHGKHECLALLLGSRAKATIDEQNIHGETALMKAVNSDRLECVQLLIDAGARVDLQDKYGQTALHHCSFNSSVEASSIAKMLIDNRADINIKSQYLDITPFMKALINGYYLINITWIKNADLDIQDDKGQTALIYAIEEIQHYPHINSYKNAKLIIASGANIMLKDHDGKTALDTAQQILDEAKEEQRLQELGLSIISNPKNPRIYETLEEYTEIVELLKQRESGVSTLEIAKQIRDEISKEISECPLHGHALYDESELETYNELIEMLEQQMSLTNSLVTHPYWTFCNAATDGDTEKLKEMILLWKPKLDLLQLYGEKALVESSSEGHLNTTSYLLEQGVNPNAEVELGRLGTKHTILEWAIISHNDRNEKYIFRNNLPTIKLLIENGALITSFAKEVVTYLPCKQTIKQYFASLDELDK